MSDPNQKLVENLQNLTTEVTNLKQMKTAQDTITMGQFVVALASLGIVAVVAIFGAVDYMTKSIEKTMQVQTDALVESIERLQFTTDNNRAINQRQDIKLENHEGRISTLERTK